MSFEVGYRKPPKASQFKKGQSGNKRGRPKGSTNLVTVLDKELAKVIVITENGKKQSVSRLQAITKRLVANALQGDLKSLLALVEILRRTGKLDDTPPENLLPDDYESILESYVATRQHKLAAPADKRIKETAS